MKSDRVRCVGCLKIFKPDSHHTQIDYIFDDNMPASRCNQCEDWEVEQAKRRAKLRMDEKNGSD